MNTNDRHAFVGELEDEFGSYLEEAKTSPTFRAEYEDTHTLRRLIDNLVKLRKALKLSQTEVARRMGIGQSTVAGFEREASDPRLSTLQRYARAVEAQLSFKIELPAHRDWVSVSTAAYGANKSITKRSPIARESNNMAQTWARSLSENTQNNYEKAA